MTAVLVTDGDQRAALATVRSLGRAGRRVLVCAKRARSLAAASRYCAASAAVPDPLLDPEGYRAAVAGLVRRWNARVLLPISEASMLALLPQPDQLGAFIPAASLTRFREVADKARVLEHAHTEGIAVPRQTLLRCPGDVALLPADASAFPLVLKPARSVAEADVGRMKHAVTHVASSRELRDALAAYPPSAYPILAQQRIVGPGIGVFLLLWDGVLRAQFAHRRLREKPPAGGVSVYRESAPLPPALLDATLRLLQRFAWQGVAMVEYKLDAATGTPYLMEINGRFWGSLQLAIDAGVDFPELLVRCALGEPVQPISAYRLGVRSRWWWGDVDHLLARLRRSPAELHLDPDSPGRWQTLLAFLRPQRRDRNEVLRWNDPLPFVQESVDWIRQRD